MVKHYLKMAIRQILKNKVQYLLSIVGIAIGLLCFSMTSYYIRRFNSQFTVWSNNDRMANLYVKSEKNKYNEPYIPGKELQALMSNSVAGMEKIAYSYSYGKANITISNAGQEEIPFQCSFQNITEDFPVIFGMQTLEGKMPVWTPGEVWISESSARRIFGEDNPIGRTLYFSRADTDTSAVQYSTISAVVRDLPDGSREKNDFYFPEISVINPDRKYSNVVVMLAKGVSSTEINQRLRKQLPVFGKNNDNYLAVMTFKEEMYKPDNLGATLFIPLIGALILIAAMINFLKFCIQSFYNRTKELSLRKNLGSGSVGLFCLLFSEIAILFLLSALVSFVMIEWFIPVFYQYLASKEVINENMLIHLPTLIWQELEYLCLLFIICLLIAAWAVFRSRHNSLIEGVKGGKRQKHGVRNFMLGVQLFICFLFISGAIGIGYIHQLVDGKRNNTLTEEECTRIWKVELWEPQLQGHEEEIVSRIRTLAGVEDIVLDRISSYPDYKTKREETIHGIEYAVSSNYSDFMNLKIEGRMPRSSNEIVVSRSLVWRLGILSIVRSKLPESIPFLLTTKQEERFRYIGGEKMMSELFMLLSVISLIITVLGIYSAITLDTYSRQKEVAIRKINGAGPRVIALLFGKLYIRLLVIAAIPSLTIVYLFLRMLISKKIVISAEWLNNPVLWLSIIFLTTTIVFITVAYRIWLISRLNPAEVIKSE